MTAVHPAVAYEPSVLPEPLAEPAKLIQLLRLVRDNQLSMYTRDSFVADFADGDRAALTARERPTVPCR